MSEIKTEGSVRVVDTIAAIIRDILNDQGADPRCEHGLRDELGLDSADIAELLVELQERLGVELPDALFGPTESTDPLATVGSLAAAVVEHRERASNARN